jgi:hypothetical protein
MARTTMTRIAKRSRLIQVNPYNSDSTKMECLDYIILYNIDEIEFKTWLSLPPFDPIHNAKACRKSM